MSYYKTIRGYEFRMDPYDSDETGFTLYVWVGGSWEYLADFDSPYDAWEYAREWVGQPPRSHGTWISHLRPRPRE
jgi:hypothetical protein